MTEPLPLGWVSTSLGEICAEKVAQGTPSDEPVAYIDISSIDRSSKRTRPTNLVTAENAPTRARQWVRTGDVLVSMTRPNLNAVAQVGPDLDGAVASTGFDVLRPLEVLPGWVFYRVRSSDFIADVCEDLQGVVYPAIRPHDVRRHRLPLPPIGEQQRIVEALESYFTRLDDAEATLERVQRNLKRYRASVLQAAVEGWLVPTEAELARAEDRDYEPASVLLERILAERRRRWEEAELARLKAKGKAPRDDRWRAKYRKAEQPDSEGTAKLAEGWCWTTLDSFLVAIEAGKNFKCEERAPEDGEIGVVKVSSVTWGTFDEDESKTCTRLDLVRNDHLIREGDFLISRANTIELVGACVIAGHLNRKLMLSDKILRFTLVEPWAGWLLWTLRSPWGRAEIERLATGNQESMRNITQENLRRIRIPLPPASEAERSLFCLEAALSIAEEGAATARVNAKRSARLRQSILKWAFEGRLVDQDPTDEPAATLLERIRAEREAEGGRVRSRGRRGRRQEGAAEPTS